MIRVRVVLTLFYRMHVTFYQQVSTWSANTCVEAPCNLSSSSGQSTRSNNLPGRTITFLFRIIPGKGALRAPAQPSANPDIGRLEIAPTALFRHPGAAVRLLRLCTSRSPNTLRSGHPGAWRHWLRSSREDARNRAQEASHRNAGRVR